MEKRVAGIIRWLERCVKAYKDGAVESALMDAECARADIEALRGDLWRKLEQCHNVRVRRLNFFKTAEAFFWAFGIMLITATPLALQQDGPTGENRSGGNFTLEWVTPDEMELLGNLRRRPGDSLAVKPEEPMVNAGQWTADSKPMMTVEPEEPIVEHRVTSVPVEPVRRRSPEPPSSRNEQNEQSNQSNQKEPETGLTYDRILSLIETGERAMKNEAPAIRVENAN